eukprot:TRINITY_DN620_c0_g1_i6.p1 TRINITY_DN620_c0_g1~~TRINITY_DN620_c0_g1_i6.p1  ORF type:complete len:470 (-),score=92.62 TRINITY_DN620_c0_g1_i6:456-1832(-)
MDPQYCSNHPPPIPEYTCKEHYYESGRLSSPNYWRALCPKLHICDGVYGAEKLKKFLPSSELLDNVKKSAYSSGYFCLPSSEIPWSVNLQDIAESVVLLMQYGYPPTFIAMYDEIWVMLNDISDFIESVSHTRPNVDFVTFYVNPDLDQAGFLPHRDRCMDNPEETFFDDGAPKYSTVWIPLTDACTDNSCLCVIPKQHDPGYMNNSTRFVDPYGLQNIKVLPCEAGSVIWMSHRIVHWGTAGTKGYHTPRIAIACGFASEDFEPPYFDIDTQLPFPDFDIRLSFVGGQALLYSCRFSFTTEELKLWDTLFSKKKEAFQKDYVAQVERKYSSALSKIRKREAKKNQTDPVQVLNDEDEEERLQPYPEHILIEQQGCWGLYKDGLTGQRFWLHKTLNITGWYPPSGWIHNEFLADFNLEDIPQALHRHQQMQSDFAQRQQRILEREAKKGHLGVEISWK